MKLKLSLLLVFGMTATLVSAQQLVGDKLTNARAADGMYISWKEHIIDDPESAGFALSGSDGLVMADLDKFTLKFVFCGGWKPPRVLKETSMDRS